MDGAHATEYEVAIRVSRFVLRAMVGVPATPRGLVLFAHGSGSGRLSPRNAAVARVLQTTGLITVLADLLTDEEADDRRLVFDIPLLADRLLTITEWARERPGWEALPVGYFGASTGGGAALVAAARLQADIAAVVSRGGRPDLAAEYLDAVTAPTLLIVGERDKVVLDLNRRALARLPGRRELAIVPGATHLFEEPGALEGVARLASHWFLEAFGLS